MSDLDALLEGRHHDPHRLLGLHIEGSRLAIRALRPGAREVVARLSGLEVPLQRKASDLFEGFADKQPVDHGYELEVVYQDGTRQVEQDAYGFPPTISDFDLHLFGEGRHQKLPNMLGARTYAFGTVEGVAFSVWAPNAKAVSLIGDFNYWNAISLPMRSLGVSGIWELFVPGVHSGAHYRYSVLGHDDVHRVKADPVALWTEPPPQTASRVFRSSFSWSDDDWMAKRDESSPWREPISIYEVHLGSWRRGLSYREAAEELADYVSGLGFTHVELMPIMEHPFTGSWGYQVSGFFAPTARFGDPDDFRSFVDVLHRHGIGVILDWVPAHFPKDDWSLARFDGTALYEHEDERRGFHPDWGTLVFNHGRNEVRSFLISSALHWLEDFHADGLRVDAVASMIYLDYSRRAGEWLPNRFGGNEDLEAIDFLRELNTVMYDTHPSVMMIAEESTAWPGVTRAASEGGLGFGFKWNMGWMHDTLAYFSHDPIHRRYHHEELTFASIYSFSENFILPLSHDEVVYGKRSLLLKMPGDRWQQLANLRALYGFMWAHPGKQLLFMGGEFAQEREWNHDRTLDWDLLSCADHAGIQRLVGDLNRLQRDQPAIWLYDSEPRGFRWISASDADNNVIAFARIGEEEAPELVCVCNLSPVPREDYRIGMPRRGRFNEVLNTDSSFYGGSDVGNGGSVVADGDPLNGLPTSCELVLPPLSTLWFVAASES